MLTWHTASFKMSRQIIFIVVRAETVLITHEAEVLSTIKPLNVISIEIEAGARLERLTQTPLFPSH